MSSLFGNICIVSVYFHLFSCVQLQYIILTRCVAVVYGPILLSFIVAEIRIAVPF